MKQHPGHKLTNFYNSNQNKTDSAVFNNTLSCTSLVSGLSSSDCSWLSSIGFAGQGSNPTSGNMFIGENGPNKFVFTNNAGVDVVLMMWDDGSSPKTSTAPYVSGYAPAISWSLSHGASVTVSVADTVSGGFAGVYVGSTGLDSMGQIYQTWGEFTTGPDATVDVSREVNKAGNSLSITTSNGCTSDMNDCVFECNGGESPPRNPLKLMLCLLICEYR